MRYLTFQIASLFYIVLLFIVYFSKKRVNNFDNKVFSVLIITNLVGVLFDIISTALAAYCFESILLNPISKCYLIYIVTWLFAFTIYVIYISSEMLSDKFKNVLWNIGKLIYAFFVLLIIILPLYNYASHEKIYTYGPAPIVTYAFAGMCSIIWFVSIFLNRKSLNKKYIPLLAFVIVSLIAGTIQFNFPQALIITFVLVLVNFLMYFTIENPDIKMIQQLEMAKEHADKANQAKTDFLSSMSHEIRTPLNAIVNFSDGILEADSLDEAQENAKDIVNASKTLLEIVNGILDISKIEAGKLEIINTKYHPKETFEELAKLITPKMNEKALDFTYYIAPDIPDTLFGDHANIKKIVTNLLSNACKYTPSGYVRYEVNCVNNGNLTKLIISVEDSGRGIKKDSVDKLFTKFQRLEEDRNTTIEGTGLGLAITKQLIELMGGSIVVNTDYGKGSKFTVFLTQEVTTAPTEETKKVSTTLDLKDVKILIVDDNELNLKVASKLLERYKANCITTSPSGFDCLDRINRGEAYDIILLDDMMPKMSGIETFEKLKQINGFNIPVVALTANAINGMREKYLSLGFDDYLAKPIEKDKMILVFNQILDRFYTDQITPVNKSQNKADDIEILDVTDEVLGDKKTELIPVVSINSSSLEKNPENYLKEHGVDLDHALELLGDMEMYDMTVTDFLSEVDSKWQRIIDNKNKSDMVNYAIDVHSLKSDCKYLGFMKLADISYQHELKSKGNDINFVNNHFLELENEYHNTLNIVREYSSKYINK